MHTFIVKKRIACVVRSLRLIADSLEAADHPSTVRAAVAGLNEASTLLRMGLYENQRELIERAALDMDAKEAK